MIDRLGRNITYLRISVTDKCNLRCRYCMPEEGICKKNHADMLTEDEIIGAVEVAASLGITKLRITGGEPLVKKNILSICRRAAAVEGIREVCLTTNGLLLPQLAKPLREAGVSRINLSLDTLKPDKYAYITRIGTLDAFRAGLDAAFEAGFEKITVTGDMTRQPPKADEDRIIFRAERLRASTLRRIAWVRMVPSCWVWGKDQRI